MGRWRCCDQRCRSLLLSVPREQQFGVVAALWNRMPRTVRRNWIWGEQFLYHEPASHPKRREGIAGRLSLLTHREGTRTGPSESSLRASHTWGHEEPLSDPRRAGELAGRTGDRGAVWGRASSPVRRAQSGRASPPGQAAGPRSGPRTPECSPLRTRAAGPSAGGRASAGRG